MRLLRYFQNYVKVRVWGENPEKWISIAIRRDISVWKLTREQDGSFTLCLPRIDYWRHGKSLCRKTGCHSRVCNRCGILYTFRQAKRRKALLISSFVACALICMLSSMVWSVEIIPGASVTAQDIVNTEKILLQYGVKPGVFVDTIDQRGVANNILQSEPGLCWAQVRREGTRIYVEIERGTYYSGDLPKDTPCDLVSNKDFELVKCTVYQGKSVYVPGQIVRKGEVVIAGIEDGVHASGEVQGRTWYTAKVDVVYEAEQIVATGKKDSARSLFLFGIYIPLPGKNWLPWYDLPSKHSSQTTTMSYWTLPGDIRLPIGVRTISTEETTLKRVSMNEAEGLAYARMQASLILDQKIPDDAQILSTAWKISTNDDGSLVYEITAECIERINMKIVDKL